MLEGDSGGERLDRLALAALPLARHQAVTRSRLVQNLARDLDTGDWETGWVQLANLHQYRSLIPVDMLARKLAVSKLHDPDDWDLDRPARRGNAWQPMVDHPRFVHLSLHLSPT